MGRWEQSDDVFSIIKADHDDESQTAAMSQKLAVASIARDDPSTLPGDDPFPRARIHRDHNAWKISIGI